MKAQLQPLIISAPFGNYVQPVYSTPTLGTFTRHARPPGSPDDPVKGGRLWRILKTVRYNPFLRRWRNKIGLRNPGIEWLYDKWLEGDTSCRGSIISVHGFNADEWRFLLNRASQMGPAAIEINASCPNVEDDEDPNIAFKNLDAMVVDRPVIVKLPPQRYMSIVADAVDCGIETFHACNTLPGPKGGFSGKPLKRYSLGAVANIKREYPDVTVIGGGGITGMKDIEEYWEAGADHVAVASCLFFPWNILKFGRIARQLDELETTE